MHTVEVRVWTQIGKEHCFCTPYHFSKVYGHNDDLIFRTEGEWDSNGNCIVPPDDNIVSNREISNLVESEQACQIVVTCIDCKNEGIHTEWRFRGLTVNEDLSISYDEASLTTQRIDEATTIESESAERVHYNKGEEA